MVTKNRNSLLINYILFNYIQLVMVLLLQRSVLQSSESVIASSDVFTINEDIGYSALARLIQQITLNGGAITLLVELEEVIANPGRVKSLLGAHAVRAVCFRKHNRALGKSINLWFDFIHICRCAKISPHKARVGECVCVCLSCACEGVIYCA